MGSSLAIRHPLFFLFFSLPFPTTQGSGQHAYSVQATEHARQYVLGVRCWMEYKQGRVHHRSSPVSRSLFTACLPACLPRTNQSRRRQAGRQADGAVQCRQQPCFWCGMRGSTAHCVSCRLSCCWLGRPELRDEIGLGRSSLGLVRPPSCHRHI